MYNSKFELLSRQITGLEGAIAAVEGTVDYAKQTTSCSSEQVSSLKCNVESCIN
jgi:hypothetical protein